MTEASTSPRDAYREQGFFLHPEPVVPEGLVRRARERIAAVVKGEYDTRIPPWRRWNLGDVQKMQKIDQVHLCDEAFHALVTHPAIGELVARVTGAELVQVWATQLLIKPPQGRELGVIGWHADAMNWPFWEGEALTVWLGLDDVAEDAGALMYVAGSHLWPRAEKQGDAYLQDLHALEEQIKTRGPARSWHKVPVLVRAGGAGVHSKETLHGSDQNRTSTARIGLGINVRTQGARPKPGVEDYGYTSYLHHPFVCPIIYQAPPLASRPPRDDGPRRGDGESPPPRRAAGTGDGAVEQKLAFVMPHLREGTSVLCAGRGSGTLALRIAKAVSPAIVTAIDLDAQAVQAARASAEEAGLANVRFEVADVLHLLFEDGAFGAVICHDLLAHLSNSEAAVKELFRVCAPGGLVGARELLDFSGQIGSISVQGAERPVLDLLRLVSHLGPGRPNAGVELRGMLHDAGFRDVRTTVGHEVFQDEGDRVGLAAWLAPLLSGELGARAVRAGLVTREALGALALALASWPPDPGAVGVVSWIEHVATRPDAAGPR